MSHPHADATAACPLCAARVPSGLLRWVDEIPAEVINRIQDAHPEWQRPDGACPACVQDALLDLVRERGEDALHEVVQQSWPMDPRAAFGPIPTPLRMRADPRYGGKGVTIALLDSGFYPHPDLTEPRNRIRCWVNAAVEPVQALHFGGDAPPRWPGWDAGHPSQWHGLMTSAAAAGAGQNSYGVYRGMAPESKVVLIQVRDEAGHIGDEAIIRGLRWIGVHAHAHDIRVVNLSVAGDDTSALTNHPVDIAVAELVAMGLVVIAAAGNDGVRHLVPPATAPQVITVGGLDDRNAFDRADVALWHSNFGASVLGAPKPEIVAPSLRVVAPILPGSSLATEAAAFFAKRFGPGGELNPDIEREITNRNLITSHYQQVEGTSFAAPIVAGTVSCMLEANPTLSPRQIKDALISSACIVPGASRERQGAGAVDAGRAVAAAVREQHAHLSSGGEPMATGSGPVTLSLHDHAAQHVVLFGSWNDWRGPGIPTTSPEAGLFVAVVEQLPPGVYQYRFLVDRTRWMADNSNPRQSADGFGGYNNVLEVRTD